MDAKSVTKRIWAIDVADAAGFLKSDLENGLSFEDGKTRLESHGPNELAEKPPTPPLKVFLQQFDDSIIWILIIAAVISGFLGGWIDALAIIGIVILSAVFGFIQESRAERSMAALKKMSSPSTRIKRNGESVYMPSSMLVPGDIIEIEAGENIPADSRLIWASANFSVVESNLTGELSPVNKMAVVLQDKDITLADRANMVYMGTSSVSGRARAIVINTGMATELGKITGMIQNASGQSTPLQKKIEEFGKLAAVLCLIFVGAVFVLEMIRGGSFLEIFLTSASLAVAAIPEGMPVVVVIALALGAQRMAVRHSIIRKLSSVEILGCTTVICTDKTGTLTKNEMTVQALFTGGNLFRVSGTGYHPEGEFMLQDRPISLGDYPYIKDLLSAAVLCNSAVLKDDQGVYRVVGAPTEGALLAAAAKAGIDKAVLEKNNIFLEEIPFDSQRKMMTVLRREKQKITAYVKGAPDVLLRSCNFIDHRGIVRPMSQDDLAKVLDATDYLTDKSMRVLAVAYRDFSYLPQSMDARLIESNLTFLGLFAMIDPPRFEVKMAVNKSREAGIKTVMITGDHKNTAIAVARELGLFSNDSTALTGEELDRISDDDFINEVGKVSVYARVSSEHKLRILKAWRAKGEVVAMTGSSVNDASVVKEADIGVAMGITGTDVTKEAADIVVADNNFASIVAAVEEGRGIYANIKKSVHYLLSCNISEVLLILCASVLNLPVPLLPIHILWVNLVADALPALALGAEPVEKNIMQKLPRHKNKSIVDRQELMQMIFQGLAIAMCALIAFCYVKFFENETIDRARTSAFIVLVCAQLFHVLNCRNPKESLFKIGLLSNIDMIWAVLGSVLLMLMAVYMPFFQMIFKTVSLDCYDWTLIVAISSLPLWLIEGVKFLAKIDFHSLIKKAD